MTRPEHTVFGESTLAAPRWARARRVGPSRARSKQSPMTSRDRRTTSIAAALALGVLALGCGTTRGEVPGVAGRPVADASASSEPPAPMVAIPSGRFAMGCRSTPGVECEDDALPVHRVRLPGFGLGRYEVTWDEYASCVEAGGCSAIKLARCYVWSEEEGFVLGAPLDARTVSAQRPVVCVTWGQARQFCEWRGQRLPAEAEWERAARGHDDRQYPWGDARPTCEHATMHGCGLGPREVGSAPAGVSPEGVHDLAGNVWEWTSDWYLEDAYRNVGSRGRPGGPSYGDVKVVRGGSFYEEADDLRASYRYGLTPDYGYSTVGLRCAS
ncbi:MAG: formylglycine-generating enzyme family protein [Myxococcales bacterium]|nr:formylglycine-generating enzyme family protein [Myxococcales bacterium]